MASPAQTSNPPNGASGTPHIRPRGSSGAADSSLVSRSSNERARITWEQKAVGSQRASAAKGTREYFEQLRAYRYGYETPFIPRVFGFNELQGKKVLEIGVGNGIDAVEMARQGAIYTGLDVTENHLTLTRQNFAVNLPEYRPTLIRGDLLEQQIDRKFDVVYSFGVLHHIAHEAAYLNRLRELLDDQGSLRIGVYSKWSFFNVYNVVRWLIKAPRTPLDDWRSHEAEGSPLGQPVTIKIRSYRQVKRLLHKTGFRVERYAKCGFVQGYLPLIGKHLHPDGLTLNAFAGLLGWYHCFVCAKLGN